MAFSIGLPRWFRDPTCVGFFCPALNDGLQNLAAGGAFYGDVAPTGGAVTQGALWPNGARCYRFSTTSGVMTSALAPTLTQPFSTIVVARVRSVAAGSVIVGGKTGLCSIIQQATAYRITTTAASGLTSGAIDLTAPHVIDGRWHSRAPAAVSQSSKIGIDGANYVSAGPTVPYPGSSGMVGLSIGGLGDLTLRSDVDVLAVVVFRGLPVFRQLWSCQSELAEMAGVALAAPPSYGNQLRAPMLSSRPALLTGTPRLVVFSIGQSNEVSYADDPSTPFPSGALSLNRDYSVTAAAYPIGSSSTVLDPIAGVGPTAVFGWQGRFATDVKARLGRDCLFVGAALTGTSVEEWLPGDGQRDRLLGAGLQRFQEAIYWGEEPACISMCQGEANGAIAPSVWVDDWNIIFQHTRQTMGLPNLPSFFGQTPTGTLRDSQHLLEQSVPWQQMQPSVKDANMQSGGVHWNATGVDLYGALKAQQFCDWYERTGGLQ